MRNLIYRDAEMRAFRDDDSRQDVIELRFPKGARQQLVVYITLDVADQLGLLAAETRGDVYHCAECGSEKLTKNEAPLERRFTLCPECNYSNPEPPRGFVRYKCDACGHPMLNP